MVAVYGTEYAWTEGAGLDPEAVLELGALVGALAREYMPKAGALHVERDDLIQAGFAGALRGARTFRPDKGCSYPTWAANRARDEMRALVRRPVETRLDAGLDGAPAPADALADPADYNARADAISDAARLLARCKREHAETLAAWARDGVAAAATAAGVGKKAMSARVDRAVWGARHAGRVVMVRQSERDRAHRRMHGIETPTERKLRLARENAASKRRARAAKKAAKEGQKGVPLFGESA